MQILKKLPTVKAPAETFTGDAWYDVIARGEEPSRIRVNVVRFAPSARNAWHAHSVGQTVHVTEGVGLIQARGEKAIEIHPGDTIHTPPRRVALARRCTRSLHDPSGNVGRAGGGRRDRMGHAGHRRRIPRPSVGVAARSTLRFVPR
jgi:hypothetical protein